MPRRTALDQRRARAPGEEIFLPIVLENSLRLNNTKSVNARNAEIHAPRRERVPKMANLLTIFVSNHSSTGMRLPVVRSGRLLSRMSVESS